MFRNFGLGEILFILMAVILLFGVGRIGKIAKELGGGIRSFKDGLKGDEKKEGEKEEAAKSEEEKKEV